MLINKANLQEALAIVKPGLATKEVIEQSTSFAFMTGRVVTYNDEISLSHPVEALDIEGAIQSDKLYQLLTKIKKDEIDLEVVGNEIVLSSGKLKAGFTLQSEIKLPLEELELKGKWKKLPENFLRYVGMAIPACSNDLTKPMMNCVHITKEGIIEASDSYKITHCELATEMPVSTFLLNYKSAALMVNMAPVSIHEGNGWVHFKTAQGTILSCRILEGDTFPDTSKFLTIKGETVTFPKTMLSVVERAAVFSKSEDGKNLPAEITLADNKLTIRAVTELGWSEEEVNAKYDGDIISFKANVSLLKEILSKTQTAILGKGKLFFQEEGWIYMTTLLM
jgi:DNA polymerase III sliding clamp (beta) subunit (PCNA family)